MSIVVFWITVPVGDGAFPGFSEPKCQTFQSDDLTSALKFCEEKRKEGMRHVTISSEMSNSVGAAGVDSIVDGKTPDGQPYTWMKRRSQ